MSGLFFEDDLTMEIFEWGNAPSSNGMHHDASGAVTTTLDYPDGGEALLQSPLVENRNDLLATLSLVLGAGAAPIVCSVVQVACFKVVCAYQL